MQSCGDVDMSYSYELRHNMWFGLLGPLLVRGEDAELPVPAAKQRVLLAALLLTPRQVVPSARLAELIWDGVPPRGSDVTLRSYIKRLRHILGSAGRERIVTAAGGYLIEVTDDELDITQYTALCSSARAAVDAGTWQQASELLGRAHHLWRGNPLADIPCRALHQTEVPRLEQLKMQVTQWRIEAELQQGQYGKVLPELHALTAEYPLREPFHRQLMIALYQSGCQADALAAYRRARSILVSEIGVEPGPDLQLVHERILAGGHDLVAVPGPSLAVMAARRPAAPRHLPPPVLNFAGRGAEIRQLTGIQRQGSAGGGTVIAVISGPAGVGKTALAVRWAHQIAESFPDGQLYLNLNGFGPAGVPVSESESIGRVLEALQVPPARIPPSLDGRRGLYRTLLAERRILMVLDNARDAEQVRPLLPGAGGSLVVVTSRSPMTSLVALEGARTLTLSVLTESEARELLAQRLGAQRIAAERVATDQLISSCARLPLALAIAAALVATRPGESLAVVAAAIGPADSRLDVLNAGDASTNLRAVFDWSYQTLTTRAAWLFRVLAEHPGPDISRPAAASLAGLPPAQASAALTELAGLHLLSETSPNRFGFHDLGRLYAAERLHALDSPGERRAAGHRMLDYYLGAARNAARAMSPARQLPELGSPAAGTQPEELADEKDATAWLKAEHHVLMRVISYAADADFDTHAWQLPWALTDFLDRNGHWHDFAASQRIALAAAIRLNDLSAQALANRYIGRACFQLQELDDALDHLGRAIDLRRQLGEPVGEAGVLIDICRVHGGRGQPDEALLCARHALSLYQSAQNRVGEAFALNAVGWYHALLGTYDEALDGCTKALELCAQFDCGIAQGHAWHSIGFIHKQMGDPAEAIKSYERALSTYRQLGDRYAEGRTLGDLGDASYALNDLPATRQLWQDALAILDELDHPDGDQLRAKIAELPEAQS
jgi:DNA-binding SARP family transcriptional activator/tetratricopeptide (TPR) repeat protein